MALLLVLLGGCASAPLSTDDGGQGLSMERALILSEARSAVGTPYRFGGNDPRGLDCSGLAQMTYSRAGIPLPRNRIWRPDCEPAGIETRARPPSIVGTSISPPSAALVIETGTRQ